MIFSSIKTHYCAFTIHYNFFLGFILLKIVFLVPNIKLDKRSIAEAFMISEGSYFSSMFSWSILYLSNEIVFSGTYTPCDQCSVTYCYTPA
jgi:hypothetical protein